MKTFIAVVSICLMLPLACSQVVKVKTLDGRKLAKDSVAEFDIAGEGGQTQDSSWSVQVADVDGFQPFGHSQRGKRSPARQDTLSDSIVSLDVRVMEGLYCDWIGIIGSIYLPPGRHSVRVECNGMIEGHGRVACLDSFSRIPLWFNCLAGHRYSIAATIVGAKWRVWIKDKDTKEVVASTK